MSDEQENQGVTVIHTDGSASQQFGSIDEMYEQMHRHEEAALQDTLPDQIDGCSWGKYGIRMAPVNKMVQQIKGIDLGEEEIMIFTDIFTAEQLEEMELEAGASEAEAMEFSQRKHELYDRGYRSGMHYSIVEPEGELGDAHVFTMWPITKDDFAWAKAHGWKLHPGAMARVQNEIEEAITRAGGSLE